MNYTDSIISPLVSDKILSTFFLHPSQLQHLSMPNTIFFIIGGFSNTVQKNTSVDEFVWTMNTTYLHIGIILSTLGLSPHGFTLGLYPKGLIPMEIFVLPYIPMILSISSQCGTLVVYPTILPSNKGPPSLPSNR